jgi:hypothetical protein
MDLDFKPRLRHCTLIDDPSSNHTTLVIGKAYYSMERISGDRAALLKVKSLLDGRHTISEISLDTGVSTDSISDVVSTFGEAGLLQTRTADPKISIETFKDRVEDSTIMWRKQIGLHGLFSGLAEGTFRREVFIGLLIETFHYVRMLPRSLHAVAEKMPDSPFRKVILAYAEEEMDHFLDYRKALKRIDRVGPHLDDSHPTIGTLSLIRNFESIGYRDGLSLLCSLQLIEARPSEMESAEKNLLEIAGRYGLQDIMTPFIEHMKSDVASGHANLLSSALRGIHTVSIDDAHAAVNDMHDVKHCFDAFHDSIIQYYSDISNYIPRPKVDFFAL